MNGRETGVVDRFLLGEGVIEETRVTRGSPVFGSSPLFPYVRLVLKWIDQRRAGRKSG
jgi:hypothetical protein